ncbi:MAG: hypothetical protein ACOC0P_08040, partial [Planctomycetota bacterium]
SMYDALPAGGTASAWSASSPWSFPSELNRGVECPAEAGSRPVNGESRDGNDPGPDRTRIR